MILCWSCGVSGTHRICNECFVKYDEDELYERTVMAKRKQNDYDSAFQKAAYAAKALGNAYGYFEQCVDELGAATKALKEAAVSAYEETRGEPKGHSGGKAGAPDGDRIGEAKPTDERPKSRSQQRREDIQSEQAAPKKSNSTPKRGASGRNSA